MVSQDELNDILQNFASQGQSSLSCHKKEPTKFGIISLDQSDRDKKEGAIKKEVSWTECNLKGGNSLHTLK